MLSKNIGSLLLERKEIISSFDVDNGIFSGELSPLKHKLIFNNSVDKKIINYKDVKRLNIINGMGVTIGDSIVGLCVLDTIKEINPELKINVIRPKSCNIDVDYLYQLSLSKNILNEIYYMPYDIQYINEFDTNFEIGNHLYWPNFNHLEMHDFFLESLGIPANSINEKFKKNQWLKKSLPQNSTEHYVLFCPYSSTPLRTIPRMFHWRIIDSLYKKFNSVILGFSDINHPKYVNISGFSKSLYQYITIISHAIYVYTSDSSALHIAAAYDIPTFCVFTSIKPDKRSKYYRNCQSVYIGNESIEGMHKSNCDKDIEILSDLFEVYYENI